MDSVSSVMKFSETQEARPLLIHRCSRRVSACEMKRSASATVGAALAAFGVGDVVGFEDAVCPFVPGAIAASAERSKAIMRARDAIGMAGANFMRVTLYS